MIEGFFTMLTNGPGGTHESVALIHRGYAAHRTYSFQVGKAAEWNYVFSHVETGLRLEALPGVPTKDEARRVLRALADEVGILTSVECRPTKRHPLVRRRIVSMEKRRAIKNIAKRIEREEFRAPNVTGSR